MALDLLKRSETTQPLTAAQYDATLAAIEAEVNAKAPLNSPALTGTPTAPTAATGTNTTQIATTAFVLANGGSAGGGVAVQEEGSPLATTATTLNFVGAGVTASGTGTTKTVTIPGGITVQEEGSALATAATTLNFVGAGVTASGTGAVKTVTIPGGSSSSSSSDAAAVLWTPPHVNALTITVAAKLARRLSVEDFGVTGNGTADDTLALQRAIDEAGSETVGANNIAQPWTVEFPPGMYRHSGLILKNRVLLKGSGKRQTILFLISGSNKHSVTNIDPGNANYANGFQAAGLQDLMIHGGYTRTTNANYGTSATSQGADDGSWAKSYDGIHLATHGTIATNAAVAPELTGDPRNILTDVIVTGCAGTGVFLGGPNAYGNGTSYLSFGSGAMVVSNLQIYDCRRFGLHNIMNDQHFSGIEVGPCDWAGIVADGAQCCWTNCKAWYGGRDSSKWSLARALYPTGQANSRLFQPRQFGTNWLIKDNNTCLGIKSQDSAGHGIVCESLRIQVIGFNADQVGELAGPPGATEWETLNGTTTDRYGVWLQGTADTFCRVEGLLTSKNNLSKAKAIVRTRGPGNHISVSGSGSHFSGAVAVERDAGVTTPYSYNGATVT